MERNEILGKIREILADIIDNEGLVLEETSSSSTIDDWDSLAHFNLVMELQNEYGIKFGAAEIQAWRNVGDIIDSVLKNL